MSKNNRDDFELELENSPSEQEAYTEADEFLDKIDEMKEQYENIEVDNINIKNKKQKKAKPVSQNAIDARSIGGYGSHSQGFDDKRTNNIFEAERHDDDFFDNSATFESTSFSKQESGLSPNDGFKNYDNNNGFEHNVQRYNDYEINSFSYQNYNEKGEGSRVSFENIDAQRNQQHNFEKEKTSTFSSERSDKPKSVAFDSEYNKTFNNGFENSNSKSECRGFGNSGLDMTSKREHANDYSLDAKFANSDNFGDSTIISNNFYTAKKESFLAGESYVKKENNSGSIKFKTNEGASNSNIKGGSEQSISLKNEKTHLVSDKKEFNLSSEVTKTDAIHAGKSAGNYAKNIAKTAASTVAGSVTGGEDATVKEVKSVGRHSNSIVREIGQTCANSYFKTQLYSLRNSENVKNITDILSANKSNKEFIDAGILNFNNKKDIRDVHSMIINHFKAGGTNLSQMSLNELKSQLTKMTAAGASTKDIAMMKALIDTKKAKDASSLFKGKITRVSTLIKKGVRSIVKKAGDNDIALGGNTIHQTTKSVKTILKLSGKSIRVTSKGVGATTRVAAKGTKFVARKAMATKPGIRLANNQTYRAFSKNAKATTNAIKKANTGVKRAVGTPGRMLNKARLLTGKLGTKMRNSLIGKSIRVVSAPFRAISGALHLLKAVIVKAALFLLAAAGIALLVYLVVTMIMALFTMLMTMIFGPGQTEEEMQIFVQEMVQYFDQLNVEWIDEIESLAAGKNYGIPLVEYKEGSEQYKSGLLVQEAEAGIKIKYVDENGNETGIAYNAKDVVAIMTVLQENNIEDKEVAKAIIRDVFNLTHSYKIVETINDMPCSGCVDNTHHCDEHERECKDNELLYHANPTAQGCTNYGSISYNYQINNSWKYSAIPKTDVVLNWDSSTKQYYYKATNKNIYITQDISKNISTSNKVTFKYDTEKDIWYFKSTDYSCKGHCQTEHIEYTCPGHTFITVNATVQTISNSPELSDAIFQFTYDNLNGTKTFFDGYGSEIANGKTNTLSEFKKTGWTTDMVEWAESLKNQDWYELYNIYVVSIGEGGGVSTTLTSAEIAEVLAKLPANTSQIRKQIVQIAASSVGKIPYYFCAWYSPAAGLDGNGFGTLVSPDVNGRRLKGLCCSHWVDWVYLTAGLGDLGGAATPGLLSQSYEISEAELKPGDLAFQYPNSSHGTNHVGIFAGRDAAGNAIWIHENAGANNVSMGQVGYWTSFRRLNIMKDK